MKVKKLEALLICIVVVVTIVVLYNVFISIPFKNYSLEVDALRDPESLFVNARVVLKNTGKMPLNDILIMYDNNRDLTENLKLINPGQTVILSPPQSASLNTVKVVTAEGISIDKQFRSPVKMPGMIGS
ncbi:hypothetical protein [Candidatus Nitrosocosmicus franklandus]|uniref:Uncharacterized protein n=1 Tax=Candidatus Nitrosocosmicus franklandianus TaxID=1798806 RepID=A0A484IIB6_9ARCH|nr:hypothetical protein [Candidatus Nitrosocosmicus franklandus]VFJ15405.1 conserved protein of unknown function [Candidatus Nitrosocosmicus franklandus]